MDRFTPKQRAEIVTRCTLKIVVHLCYLKFCQFWWYVVNQTQNKNKTHILTLISWIVAFGERRIYTRTMKRHCFAPKPSLGLRRRRNSRWKSISLGVGSICLPTNASKRSWRILALPRRCAILHCKSSYLVSSKNSYMSISKSQPLAICSHIQ